MKRPYYNGLDEAETTEAFVGTEIEATPAKGLTTLFVVGRLDKSRVALLVDQAQDMLLTQSALPPLRHIFFGANWSFDGENVAVWADTIKHFLREGFWCTLDFRPSHISVVQKTGLCRHGRFVPLIGVRVPSAFALGSNATLKVDDTSFSGTNPGVWCVSLRKILHDETVITRWADYSKDIPLA